MKVYATTILGSPASGCAHFGICRVESLTPEQWGSFQPQHYRHVKAILSFFAESGLLRFGFPLSAMRADTRQAFFPPEGFRIDSPGYLPGHLAEAIGTQRRIILPGLYALAFSEEEAILEAATALEAIPGPQADAWHGFSGSLRPARDFRL